MQLKITLALLSLIIIGVSLFLLLRKKSDPDDTVPESVVVSDELEQPTPTTTLDASDELDIKIEQAKTTPDVSDESDIKTEPAKTAPVVSDEPDINIEPDVTITPTKPVPKDLPVQPTPTTTPAKPLIDKPQGPLLRLLTNDERATFNQKNKTAMDTRIDNYRKDDLSESDFKRKMCSLNFQMEKVKNIAAKTRISESDIKVIMDPRITRDVPIQVGGFIPSKFVDVYMENRKAWGEEMVRRCQTYSVGRKRLLTRKELDIFMDKLINHETASLENYRRTRSKGDFEIRSCESKFIVKTMRDAVSKTYVSESDIKVIVDPKITRPDSIGSGFIPMGVIETHRQFMKGEGEGEMNRMCQLRRPPPGDQLVVAAGPATGSSDRINENEIVIGTRGKFAEEGGTDINNGVNMLSFKPAKSADIHIEHVDVHRADPVNKNGSITFIYQGGIKHKFVFVGNEGLRFQKQDGSFGPNLGVGDVSKTVLIDMGLNYLTYKIECLRTTGRNTWHFKPLRLDRGLIGIELSDNADWGGLRGVYINIQLAGYGSTTAASKAMLSEFRRGWPNGTKWNLRGATGNDRQRCNDICKSLGYNYFTHNPPPHDGGCGCSKSSKKLSQLNMTDHVNAKTRRVV